MITPRSQFQPAPQQNTNAAAPSVRTALRPEQVERRVLVIGKGISITGDILDAERVVVEGTLVSPLLRATEFSVAPGGNFKGEAEVEDAEIAGSVDGVVTARGSLQVRSPGRLAGIARCRRLQVEDGGQITGKVEMLTDTPAAEPEIASTAATSTVTAPAETAPSLLPIKPDLNG